MLIKITPLIDSLIGDEKFPIEIKLDARYKVEDHQGNVIPSQKKLNLKTDCYPGIETICKGITLFYNPSLSFSGSYSLSLREELDHDYEHMVTGFKLEFVTGDPKFIYFMSYLKSLSFVVSLICFLLFYKKIKEIPKNMIVQEQKMIFTLSVLLLFYNDPFYAIIFYHPSFVNVLLTTIFNTAFFAYLLYFWMVIYERMYTENS